VTLACSEPNHCKARDQTIPGNSVAKYEYFSCGKCKTRVPPFVSACHSSAGCQPCLLNNETCDDEEDYCCPVWLKIDGNYGRYESECLKKKCTITGRFKSANDEYPDFTPNDALCLPNVGIQCPNGKQCEDLLGIGKTSGCITPRKDNMCLEPTKRQFTCGNINPLMADGLYFAFCNCSPTSQCDGSSCKKCSLLGKSCSTNEDCCKQKGYYKLNGPLCMNGKCTLCGKTGEGSTEISGRHGNCKGQPCCDPTKACKLGVGCESCYGCG